MDGRAVGMIGSQEGAGDARGGVSTAAASSRPRAVIARGVLRAVLGERALGTVPMPEHGAEDAVAAPALMTLRRKSAGEPEREAPTSHRSSPTMRGVSAESVSDDPRWNRQVAASSIPPRALRVTLGPDTAACDGLLPRTGPTPERHAEGAAPLHMASSRDDVAGDPPRVPPACTRWAADALAVAPAAHVPQEVSCSS